MIINNQTFTGSFKAFGFAAPFIYHLKITNNHVNMQDIVLNVSFLFKQTFFYLLNCGKLSTDPSRLNSFQNSFCNPNLLSLKNSKVQLARIYFKCSPSSSRQLSSLVPSSAPPLPFSSEAAAFLKRSLLLSFPERLYLSFRSSMDELTLSFFFLSGVMKPFLAFLPAA